MKKMMLILFLNSFFYMFVAAEPVCHKCEEIREYNRTHKETDFIYYEDYLKDKEAKSKQNATQSQPHEEAESSEQSN